MITDGIYDSISITQYHEEKEHLSASWLKHAAESLKEFKYYQDNQKPEERKSYFDFGNVFELSLLCPNKVDEVSAVMDEEPILRELEEKRPDLKKPRGSKEFQDWQKAFYEANAGKYIIDKTGAEGLETVLEMVKSCKDDETISKLLGQVELQPSIFWTDTDTGLQLKTRPDVSKQKKNTILDVKTIRRASPQCVAYEIKDRKYWLQAVMQIDGCIKSGFLPAVDNYFWLFVEKEPPFCACLYEFSEFDRAAKSIEYRAILSRIAEAKKTGIYPGYQEIADNKFGILTAKIL